MVFSVTIDARAIKECQTLGKVGLSVVASLLNSLRQNCFLIERRESPFSIKSFIENINDLIDSFANEGGDFNARERIKADLKNLRMSSRVKSFHSDETSGHPVSPEEIMASLVNVVDQLIVAESCDYRADNVVSLLDYSSSSFELHRSIACSKGISKKKNQCRYVELLSEAFGTLLLWSDQVYIIDYSLGANWRNDTRILNKNYVSAIPHLCSFFLSLDRAMLIVIWTTAPRKANYEQGENLVAEIEQEFMKRLKGSRIQICVKIQAMGVEKAHSRYLYSHGFFIDIDKGIDNCFSNGMVRKVSFGFKDDEELKSEIGGWLASQTNRSSTSESHPFTISRGLRR